MISSDNFEMYCMLYSDGELSPAEIQELLSFLAANPHLETEWNRWQQLKLSAPVIQFPHPEQLMQPGNAIISEADAWLFLDEELSESEHSRIVMLLNSNAAARKRVQELTTLKLTPDFVACPDKASLYKKERSTRIITFRSVIRIAAAALTGWLLFTYFPITPKTHLSPADVVNQPKDVRHSQDLQTNPKMQKDNPIVSSNAKTTRSTKHSFVSNILKPTLPISEKSISIDESNQNLEISTPSKPDPVNSTLNNLTTSSETASENTATSLPEIKAEKNNSVQSVIYKELDIQSTRETITIGTMEIREGKIRGIIRRAQALFKNKNNITSQPAEAYKVLPAVQIIQN